MENIFIVVGLVGFVTVILVAGIGYLRRAIGAIDQTSDSSEEHAAAKAEVVQLRERLSGLEDDLSRVAGERDQLRSELSDLTAEHAQLKTRHQIESEASVEKLRVLEESEKRLVEQFENLANRIFDEKHKKFSTTSKESCREPVKAG